ncbi:hypothetical protein TYRP_003983 [Tyrophagus putrescentiae]|nr:hypothetical protein TYRP_003983 [Tyrophagus putrescentiae]
MKLMTRPAFAVPSGSASKPSSTCCIWIIAAVFCGDEGEREIVLKEAAAAAAFLSIENSKLKSGSEMMARLGHPHEEGPPGEHLQLHRPQRLQQVAVVVDDSGGRGRPERPRRHLAQVRLVRTALGGNSLGCGRGSGLFGLLGGRLRLLCGHLWLGVDKVEAGVVGSDGAGPDGGPLCDEAILLGDHLEADVSQLDDVGEVEELEAERAHPSSLMPVLSCTGLEPQPTERTRFSGGSGLGGEEGGVFCGGFQLRPGRLVLCQDVHCGVGGVQPIVVVAVEGGVAVEAAAGGSARPPQKRRGGGRGVVFSSYGPGFLRPRVSVRGEDVLHHRLPVDQRAEEHQVLAVGRAGHRLHPQAVVLFAAKLPFENGLQVGAIGGHVLQNGRLEAEEEVEGLGGGAARGEEGRRGGAEAGAAHHGEVGVQRAGQVVLQLVEDERLDERANALSSCRRRRRGSSEVSGSIEGEAPSPSGGLFGEVVLLALALDDDDPSTWTSTETVEELLPLFSGGGWLILGGAGPGAAQGGALGATLRIGGLVQRNSSSSSIVVFIGRCLLQRRTSSGTALHQQANYLLVALQLSAGHVQGGDARLVAHVEPGAEDDQRLNGGNVVGEDGVVEGGLARLVVGRIDTPTGGQQAEDPAEAVVAVATGAGQLPPGGRRLGLAGRL